MKHLKILGLAVVAAAALMAFVGASSASATVLCSTAGAEEGTTCPAGWAYPKGQVIEANLVPKTNAVLHTKFKTIECSKSSVKGETNAEEGEPLSGPEGSLSFGECNCTVTVLKAGTLSITHIAGTNNGKLRSSKNETTVVCSSLFGNVHCIYATENTEVGTLEGGKPAIFTAAAEIPFVPTDLLCSEESFWNAKYEVTNPSPLFVAGHT